MPEKQKTRTKVTRNTKANNGTYTVLEQSY